MVHCMFSSKHQNIILSSCPRLFSTFHYCFSRGMSSFESMATVESWMWWFLPAPEFTDALALHGLTIRDLGDVQFGRELGDIDGDNGFLRKGGTLLHFRYRTFVLAWSIFQIVSFANPPSSTPQMVSGAVKQTSQSGISWGRQCIENSRKPWNRWMNKNYIACCQWITGEINISPCSRRRFADHHGPFHGVTLSWVLLESIMVVSEFSAGTWEFIPCGKSLGLIWLWDCFNDLFPPRNKKHSQLKDRITPHVNSVFGHPTVELVNETEQRTIHNED